MKTVSKVYLPEERKDIKTVSKVYLPQERKEIKTVSKVYLPEDVIFYMLAKLPVRTLLKFRCVSKSWAHLIDSPEFIKSHLNLSLVDSKSQKFIFDTQLTISGQPSFMFLPGNFNSPQNLVSPVELYSPEPTYYMGKNLVGSSGGLVCMQYFKRRVCLCNPWTRKYKLLPRSPLESGIRFYTNCGFGYDDIHDDYKVIRVGELQTQNFKFGLNLVEVYCLKLNKWKTIENSPNTRFDYGANGVLLNHTLHWILRHRHPESGSIVKASILAIDLRTEEAQLLSLPREFKCCRTIENGSLGVLDGALCISNGGSFGLEFWLMKDYGIKDSWIKLLQGQPCKICRE